MMTANMVYQWSRNSYAVDPGVVGDAITRIANRNDGVCQASDLVDAARKESSRLHSLFTWDNTVAADKWRTHEARNVINSLVVTVTVNDEEIKAPAFYSVGHTNATKESGEGYRPVSVVVADPALRQEALDEVLHKLQSLRSRYAALEALAPVWEALDQIAA